MPTIDRIKRWEAVELADNLYDSGRVEWEHEPGWGDWDDYDLFESLNAVGYTWDGSYWQQEAEERSKIAPSPRKRVLQDKLEKDIAVWDWNRPPGFSDKRPKRHSSGKRAR